MVQLLTMDDTSRTCQDCRHHEIRLLGSIGKGSFGVVYKAVWQGANNTPEIIAVKKVETDSEVAAIKNEIAQLGKVHHENIIQLYDACKDYKFMVMEYADGGSLYQLLHSSPLTQYNLAHGMLWLLQCAKAVAYLHALPRPVLHRDLKPPNLLLTKGAKVLKLCDFGTACELSTVMTDNRGSAAWMAPEVFEGQLYTEKCDVYSWGIILWEVITRRVPFHDLGLAVRIMWAVHQRQRPPLIQGAPKIIENLMTRCWDHDQDNRPRMEEVIESVQFISKYLKGYDEPIINPPPYSDDSSITDSNMSHCDNSSAGHTSKDVSDGELLSCNTSNDVINGIPRHQLQTIGTGFLYPQTVPIGNLNPNDTWASDESSCCGGAIPPPGSPINNPSVTANVVVDNDTPWSISHSHRRSSSYGTPGSGGIDLNKLVHNMPTYQIGGVEGVLKWKDPPHPAFISPGATTTPTAPRGNTCSSSSSNVVVTSMPYPAATTAAPTVITSTTTSYLKPTSVPYQQPPTAAAHLLHPGSSHNGGGEHSSSSSGSSSTDDKELGAFWELLDREIRPLPPLANSADSQQIFSDHKEMARAYLVMQQELFNLRKSKTDLEGKLSEAEQLEQMNNHRYQNKILELEGKRENLRNNHKRLRQQLEHIRSQTARGASHNHPPP